MVRTSDFDYYLPQELIAQTPVEPRDQARLMVLNRSDGSVRHYQFFELADFLIVGDVLIFNDTRVIPARLNGHKSAREGRVEVLLLRRLEVNVWEALVRPGKRGRIGDRIEIAANPTVDSRQDITLLAEVIDLRQDGIRVMRLSDETLLPSLGKAPLPPYIHAPLTNPERYQTVYAKVAGSVAAPTAGLHFTPELLEKLISKGVRCQFVTLHIGLDTFQPVREDDPTKHTIHREYGVLSQDVASELSHARAEGRRIICVGTTSVRLVEAAAQASNPLHLKPFEGWVSLFILPGYQFRVVDVMITNFHLPRSTLLMLLSAFAGSDLIKHAYEEAINQGYRFYSFGDAMLIF